MNPSLPFSLELVKTHLRNISLFHLKTNTMRLWELQHIHSDFISYKKIRLPESRTDSAVFSFPLLPFCWRSSLAQVWTPPCCFWLDPAGGCWPCPPKASCSLCPGSANFELETCCWTFNFNENIYNRNIQVLKSLVKG